MCSRPINKEKISQEEKTLTDRKWLETVVQPKFPKWSIEDLREQWRAHHKRGKEKGTWVPSDRQHFLKAWMPNAGDPPPAKKNPTPGYWTDFISERYPNAVIRDFATLKRDYPSLVDEGARWAEANGRQDKKAS